MWPILLYSLLTLVAVAVGGVAVVLAARGGYSYYRHVSTKRNVQEGLVHLRERRDPQAMACFLKAWATWELNSYDGGRESLQRDLDQLAQLASGIFKVLGNRTLSVREELNSLISEMKQILRDRENFGIDGRSMHPDIVKRWTALCERLESARQRLRTECDPKVAAR